MANLKPGQKLPPKPKTKHTKLSPIQVARRKDPGGLWRERKAFSGAIAARLTKLAKDVGRWVERAAANPTLVTNALPSDPAKAKEFQTWLEGQLKDGLLETVDGPIGVGEVPWTDQYVRPVYRKALIDTYGAAKGPLPEGIGGADWLQQAFNGPVAVRSLGHIYNRQYAGLKDITTSMEATLQRTLVNAMAQGQDVRSTARQLQAAVGFSKGRAVRFATTELQHAYAEGQLDAMDALGVNTVNLAVEWLTAGDDKVCPKCQAQAGKTYSTKDARGLIPFHPNCRCAWVPGVPELVSGALADGQKFIQEYNAEVEHKNALAEAAKLALLNKDPIAKYVAGLKADVRNGKDDGFALHPLPLEKFTVGDNKIIRDAANAGEWSLETVDLDALATGQRIVERDKVLEYAKNPFEAVKDEDLPLVYRRADGKLIVKDGNHRVVAALARGDKSLKVRVIPEVPIPKPVVPKPKLTPKPPVPKPVAVDDLPKGAIGRNAEGAPMYPWDATPVPTVGKPDPTGTEDRLKKLLTELTDSNGNVLTKEQLLDPAFNNVGRTWQNAVKNAPQDRDYELRLVPVKNVNVSQLGDDYLDENSKNKAAAMAKFGGTKGDVDAEDVNLYDYQPLTLDANSNIVDGNHRHAAARMLGNDYVLAVVPVEGKGTGKIRNISEFYDDIVEGKATPKPVAAKVPKPVAVPKIVKGSPYDKSKIEAYVAANVDKKGYVRAFKKVELEKAEVSFANKTAKGIKETTDIELAGLQTINGGQYGDALPYKAKALVDDPSEVKVPVVLQRPDGSRVVISGDVELTVAIANGDTHIAVKLVTMQGDVVGAAKAAADTKLAAAEAVRDAFAKKIGLQGKASLPLNEKGLLDVTSLQLALENASGMQYKKNMANIVHERLGQASRKQTLVGQIAEIEALAKQMKIIPRAKLYPIGKPRGLPVGVKVPGSDLKPLREVIEKRWTQVTPASLVEGKDGELVRARDAIFDAMAERARAMEKQHDKLKIGPPTPATVKPVATSQAIKHSHSDTMVETSQKYLDDHKELNRAYDFLNKVADRNVLAEAMPEVAMVQGRAYASASGHVALDPFTDASTVVHEYMHHIEYKLSDEGYNKLTEFITKRQGKEAVSQIYDRADLADEVGYRDDFAKAVNAVYVQNSERTNAKTAHYAGKVYQEYQGRRSTEILTIGAELLFEDPGAFAKADPEWFDLVEGVLSGRIR